MMRASIYQERFWIEWQLNPLSSKYNESLAYTINGHLNIDLLKAGFGALSSKHPMLRSQFYEHNNGLHIQFIENFKIPLKIGSVKPEQSESICNIIPQAINIPFDLRCGPLWRAKLFKLNDQRFWLVISFHHIIMDGNAFDIFRYDLSQFYNQPNTIKQLESRKKYELSLKNYFKIESSRSDDCRVDEGLQYYSEKLVDVPLQYDFDPSSGEQETFFFSLGSQMSKRLENFCLKNNCKPFRFMATVFAIFLYRYFSQKKFCMIYPVNMRQPNGQDILGSFINMQIFPITLEPNSSFEEVFAQVVASRKATQSLMLPYEKTINYLKQQAIIDQSDSANLVVSETDLKIRSIDLKNLDVASVYVPKTSLPYDISLEFERCKDDVYLQLGIKNHWFSMKYHGEQLKQHFCSIIEHVQKYPQTPLLQIPFPFIGSIQKESMMQQSMNVSSGYNMRIEKDFDQIARQCGNQVGIIDQERKITYSQLSQMAKIIATNLTIRLNKKIELVGISMRHSAELIAVMLALFKLGKAYLPIRPDLPMLYVDEIIDQSKLSFIIADHAPSYGVNQGVVVCSLKDLLIDVPEKGKLPGEVHKNNDIAYVLYTSGTTGTPKGVMVKHTSIVNLISSCQPFYKFSHQDVIPLFHSYAFDFSVWEIWSALLNGAKLLILDELATKSPRTFATLIAQYNVTVINQTPTALKQLTTYLTCATDETRSDFSSVRTIITGGEALYPHHVEALLNQKTPLRSRIFNMYGITEDSIHSTIYEVTSSFLNQTHSIIGKMLPGKYGLVVDENNIVKPMGCPGELLISGFGVAKGYFNQSVMTQEKFIQVAEDNSEKIWFKTGDQVRLLPSGEFEYIGRKDTQIKVRGYRIDCKDIEVRLSLLEGVLDVKIVIETVQGCRGLLAFLVLHCDTKISKIIALAKASLPHYMMPARFIKIEVLPRTINNKIDEKKLRKLSNMIQKPRVSITEKHIDRITIQIVDIWRTLLPNAEFGLNDNFFDCGGNSLLLVSLQLQLEKKFLVKLSIIDFFNYTTISEMAKIIRQFA